MKTVYFAKGIAVHTPPAQLDPFTPAFLITIDTEGDNLWNCPQEITTANAAFLPRFQTLCEKYRLKPTWLTNWEMVESPEFCEFAQDSIDRETSEVGMHLHAWNNPPVEPLTSNDWESHPYLIQFSELQMRQKIRAITDRLEDRFQVKMLSHRAGRWAFNESYARLLVEHGYQVDCSVSPHICWQHEHPDLPFTVDYRDFPDRAYFVDLDDISQESERSLLLEVPVTILRQPPSTIAKTFRKATEWSSLGQRVSKRLFPTEAWLRPNGRNGSELIHTLESAITQGRDFVEFMLHSSEFMPGCSPRFRSESSIEKLFEDIERLFEAARSCCVGMTLTEYHGRLALRRDQRVGSAA
jgi:hypothetical protein